MKILYSKNRKTSKLNLRFSTAILSLAVFVLIDTSAISQNIGVNPSGSLPDASAMLDVESNDKGLLVPRLTTAERDAIQNPAMSLLIFNTESECFEAWNSNSSNWVSFGCIGCYLPTVPTANTGTNINSTDFDANWSASSGVIDYYLDVSIDANFGSFVSGFNNLNVGNVTTYNVTGLTCETDYYYRVRAENVCGTTISSNVEMVTAGACCLPLQNQQQTFTYTGNSQTFTVPQGVCTVTIEAWGAQGWDGSNQGGRGGYATGQLNVVQGQQFYIYVGGQGTVSQGNMNPQGGGWNGGGNGQSNSASNTVGGGGGASDVRTVFDINPMDLTSLQSRVIVAGGGGSSTNNTGAHGGNGGGTTGLDGGYSNTYGTGGTQSQGGSSGGSLGQGGNAGVGMTPWNGGGGGGYYGGGVSVAHGGGGGGSGYIGGVTNGSMQTGVQTGNGKVTITW